MKNLIIICSLIFGTAVLGQAEPQSLVTKIDSAMTPKEVNPHYSKVLILPEINLYGLSWSDLGIDKSEFFTEPLLTSWSSWLSKHRPLNVKEISGCSGSCEQEFGNWIQIPQRDLIKKSELSRDSLWLRLNFNVRRNSYIPEINEWQFEWDGNVILLDANSKLLVSSHTIPTQKKVWRGLDQKSLNSALASHIYASALSSLVAVTKKIEESSRLNRQVRLVVSGHQHLGDVLSLIDALRKEGKNISLALKLDSFGPKEAKVLCFYQGEEKSFTDLLSGIKELKSSQSFKVVNEPSGLDQMIKLVTQ